MVLHHSSPKLPARQDLATSWQGSPATSLQLHLSLGERATLKLTRQMLSYHFLSYGGSINNIFLYLLSGYPPDFDKAIEIKHL